MVNTDDLSEFVVFEGMTSISALIKNYSLQPNHHRNIQKVYIDKSKVKSKAHEIDFLKIQSKICNFTIEYLSNEDISSLCKGTTHGGIIAVCDVYMVPTLKNEDIQDNAFYVYLDGIEDPFNYGYTIRSLYCAGVNGVILPPRNWMTEAGIVSKSSAGTSELMPTFTATHEDLIQIFRNKKYTIASAGIRDSVSIFEEKLEYPLLLIVGGEKRGIAAELLNQSDKIVRIDYGREFRGSLSTASAATIMAFEIYRKNLK